MTDVLDRLKAALSDRYAIERELGRGGMAVVYLARDLKHERSVALKVLRPELAATIGADRFLREIRIAAQLTHPHILPLHDSGEADGFLYYVMPFVEGQSLRERLVRERELPISEAVRILRDVVDALALAHSHGVIHRDIKPDNVMLSGRHALVTDFGVAKALSQASSTSDLTTAGVALGTPAYMSPEQAVADEQVDHRSDIYAVGVLAYELLTGRTPFLGTTPQMILSAHVTDTPEPVTKYRETVPPQLEHLVLRCLEKKPADRWQSAEELLTQLEALATPSGGMTPTLTRPVAQIGRGRPATGKIVGAVTAVVLFVLGVVFGPWDSRPDLVPERTAVVVDVRQDVSDLDALASAAASGLVQLLGTLGPLEILSLQRTAAEVKRVKERVTAGQVVDPACELGERLGAGTVVWMTLGQTDEKLEVHTEITDVVGEGTMAVFDVRGDVKGDQGAITEAQQRVAGTLSFVFYRVRQPRSSLAIAPVLPAARAYLDGQDSVIARRWGGAIEPFLRASALDSGLENRAMLRAMSSAWYSGRRDLHDSLMQILAARSAALFGDDKDRYEQLVGQRTGDLALAAEASRRFVARNHEYPLPGYFFSAAFFIWQTGHFQEALDICNRLAEDDATIPLFPDYWMVRGNLAHQLGDLDAAVAYLEEGRRRHPRVWLTTQLLVAALAARGDVDSVPAFVQELTVLGVEVPGRLYTWAAEEALAHGFTEVADRIAALGIAWFEANADSGNIGARQFWARTHMAARNWEAARPLWEVLVAGEDETHTIEFRGQLGVTAAMLGDTAMAFRMSAEIDSLLPQDAALSLRWRAAIAAALEDRAGAVALLERAFAEGMNYIFLPTWYDLHRAPFDRLRGYEPFERLMRPKG